MPAPIRLRIRAVWLAAGLFLAAPPHAAAQGGCQFGSGTRDMTSVEIPGAVRVTYVGGPHFVCAEGVQIWADSAVAYSAQNMSYLIGHVRYLDRTRELKADEARYFSQAARIQANGHVFLRDTVQGSEIENGNLVYLRRTSFRDKEQITVTTGSDRVRPSALLYMKPAPVSDQEAPADSIGLHVPAVTLLDSLMALPDTAQTPYAVVGDRLFLQADEYFLASGQVEIEHDSLKASADTAEYDQVAGRMLLKGRGRVEGSSYTLTGRTLNLALSGGDVSSVRASRDAVLVGEGVHLTAPLIQLFLLDGAMQRLVAMPLPGDPYAPPATAQDSADLARPVAEAEQFNLTADLVEVLAPGEVLDRILASGHARGESSARDSLNVESVPAIARTDWLEGDTIIARFSKVDPDPGLPPDTAAEEYRLEELVAHGSAKSLYRMLPSDSTSRPGVDAPAVHYVTGKSIRIVMADGEVDRMEVEGPTHGWHLEPTRAKADSVARADSVSPLDTGSVARGADSRPAGLAPGHEGRGEREPEDDGAAAPGGAAPELRARRRRSRR